MVNSEPFPGLSPLAILWFAGVASALLAGLAVVPIVLDAQRERQWRRELLGKLDPSNEHELTHELNLELMRAIRGPADVRGFTRGLIALLIVTLIGIGLAVSMFSMATDAGDIRKTIVTSLTTVLATLAGFYFGSRNTQNTAEDAGRLDSGPVSRPSTTLRTPSRPDAVENAPASPSPPR